MHLASQGSVPGRISLRARRSVTRLNHHYQTAIAMATLILTSISLDLGAGPAKGCAFLIDMNVVFERFVRSALRTPLCVDKAKFPDRAPAARLDQAGVVPLKPDLCLVGERRVLWVGDVKYKRLPSTTYQNADLYQLLAYAVALGLPGGTLVYAADKGVSAATHIVVQNNKRLEVVALDLCAPRNKLLQQIAQIANGIRPVLSPRSDPAGRLCLPSRYSMYFVGGVARDFALRHRPLVDLLVGPLRRDIVQGLRGGAAH